MFTIAPDIAVRLVVLSVCTCATAAALFFCARNNRHAWLKIAMHGWYVTACVAGVTDMLTVSAYPWTKPYWALFFNLAGQCMATTGILDVMQLRYCAPRLLTLADTNTRYLRLCVAAYALESLGFAAFFALYAKTGTGLLAYHIMTTGVIFSEALGYGWWVPRPPFAHSHAPSANAHTPFRSRFAHRVLIRKFSCSWRRAQLKARVYYLATLSSRVVILFGLVLRLIGARGDTYIDIPI